MPGLARHCKTSESLPVQVWRRPAMSAPRSLSGGKRTYRGHRISVVIDPTRTSGTLINKCGWRQPIGLPPMHLFAGRLVCATKLTCLFPNLHDFVLRPQTLELSIVEGTGCYHNA